MSISGRLDDVSVAEVLQFIHLGSRSGTLLIREGDSRAEIEFHQGRIVAARSTDSFRLGELLVVKGLIDRRTLLHAVEYQRREAPGRVLGEVLLSIGAIQREGLLQAVTAHVQETILDIVAWSSGKGLFSFAVNELRPLRGTEAHPGEVFPNVDLNTQMILLEAARIIDDRGGRGSKVAADSLIGALGEKEEGHDSWELTACLEPANQADFAEAELEAGQEGQQPEKEARGVAIVSSDEIFACRVSTALEERGFETDRLDFALGTAPLENNARLVAVVQLPEGDLAALKNLHLTKPGVALIAVSGSSVSSSAVIRAGAIACVHADPEAVVACVENVYDLHRLVLPKLEAGGFHRASLERLRQVSAEIRDGLLSTSVALSLMRVLSESVERAVLFFIAPESLVALGGFGHSTIEPNRPVAEMIKSLRLGMNDESVLQDAIIDRRPREISIAEDHVPLELIGRVGEPANGKAVLLPILGSERVILLVWVDNGKIDRPVRDVEIFDLIAGQVGVAIENELLRRRLEGLRI